MGTVRRAAGLVTMLCAVTLNGCAGARLVLEKPVAEQCTGAGLEGCPELTEGVLLFVEGNAEEGSPKLADGARQNEPEKLREFASTVEKLTSLPGISSYAGPIHAVASVLARSADEQAAKGGKTARAVKRNPERPKEKHLVATLVPDETTDGVVPAKVDLSDDASPRPIAAVTAPEIQGGTVVPIVETGAMPCQVGAPLGASMLCLTAAIGPMVLTDIHASGDCRTDLWIVDGSPEAPRWVVEAPARTALHVTGARLYARPGEMIAIVVPERPRADSRCAVTWSGAKP